MGKNGLVSIFSRLVDSAAPTSTSAAATPWQWSACGTNPQTTSFRAGAGGGDDEPCCTATPTTTAAAAASRSVHRKPAAMGRGAAPGEMYKTVNSVFLDDPAADDFLGDDDEEEVAGAAAGEGLYLDDDDDDEDGFSTTTASEEWSEEAVIRSLGRTSTDRFFFDPQPGPLPASNSILATTAAAAPETPARKKTVPVPVPAVAPVPAPFKPLTLDFLRSLLDRNCSMAPAVPDGEASAPPPPQMVALRVLVTSAVELDARQTELIARKMRRLTGFVDLKVETAVDASLIAGFVVCYGTDDSHVIDLSVRGQLAALKSRVDSIDQTTHAHGHPHHH